MSVPNSGRLRRRPRISDRRSSILDAARQVFVERGYRVSSVADICEAAQIGRGTLYQYFGNKRAVMIALMEDVEQRIARVLSARPSLRNISGAAGASRDEIVAFCTEWTRGILRVIFADEPALRLVLRDAHGLDLAVDNVIARIDQLLLAALEDDVRAAQDLGIFAEGDPRMMAIYLLGGVQKLVLMSLSSADRIDPEAIAQLDTRIALFGLLRGDMK